MPQRSTGAAEQGDRTRHIPAHESSRLVKHSVTGLLVLSKKPASAKASSAVDAPHGTPDGDKASERDMGKWDERTIHRCTARDPRRLVAPWSNSEAGG